MREGRGRPGRAAPCLPQKHLCSWNSIAPFLDFGLRKPGWPVQLGRAGVRVELEAGGLEGNGPAQALPSARRTLPSVCLSRTLRWQGLGGDRAHDGSWATNASRDPALSRGGCGIGSKPASWILSLAQDRRWEDRRDGEEFESRHDHTCVRFMINPSLPTQVLSSRGTTALRQHSQTRRDWGQARLFAKLRGSGCGLFYL